MLDYDVYAPLELDDVADLLPNPHVPEDHDWMEAPCYPF